ncbi:sulfotransferase family protein [Methylobacterium symbioticum]|uniref:Sulfotransferase domain-containing protein n=1 Tax=Methylobacterium symbioticum TaxID=2584084 RepID=A0A509E9E2_9HYPH|nr:sulfotransferase [Methylobacterium symbioticum]VUD70827.1 hypothetical protein MET9862_01400 [Methylobacterium symbioticum]
MARDTIPVFIVGSGRSGTRMIAKLLAGHDTIEAHHEYLCTHIQPVACEYYMGLCSRAEAKARFAACHGAGIHYSKARYFVDSSNKLSWLIEPILDLFPTARFIHLARDGRNVTSSFFHKLTSEAYDDDSTAALSAWLDDPASVPRPPAEKKYWWNIPRRGQPFFEAFPGFDQYQRMAYHWSESNRVILDSFAQIPDAQKLFVRLEDLTSDRDLLARFLGMVGIPYGDAYFETMQTPQGVFFPMDFKLTPKQAAQFTAIAWPMMERLGYAEREPYRVTY